MGGFEEAFSTRAASYGTYNKTSKTCQGQYVKHQIHSTRGAT
jgi:hypothetical protein